jgi:hypothetical protein
LSSTGESGDESLERNPMAAFGDLIVIVVVGFVIVAGLSLLTIGAPRDAAVRAPPRHGRQRAAAAGSERQLHP